MNYLETCTASRIIELLYRIDQASARIAITIDITLCNNGDSVHISKYTACLQRIFQNCLHIFYLLDMYCVAKSSRQNVFMCCFLYFSLLQMKKKMKSNKTRILVFFFSSLVASYLPMNNLITVSFNDE